MATDTPVNSQITDAVTQANVKVLGDAPALAMANLYQATAQALANAAHNAVSAQQQAYILAQAAAVQGVTLLYAVDTQGKETTDADVESYLEAILEEHRTQKMKAMLDTTS